MNVKKTKFKKDLFVYDDNQARVFNPITRSYEEGRGYYLLRPSTKRRTYHFLQLSRLWDDYTYDMYGTSWFPIPEKVVLPVHYLQCR